MSPCALKKRSKLKKVSLCVCVRIHTLIRVEAQIESDPCDLMFTCKVTRSLGPLQMKLLIGSF